MINQNLSKSKKDVGETPFDYVMSIHCIVCPPEGNIFMYVFGTQLTTSWALYHKASSTYPGYPSVIWIHFTGSRQTKLVINSIPSLGVMRSKVTCY